MGTLNLCITSGSQLKRQLLPESQFTLRSACRYRLVTLLCKSIGSHRKVLNTRVAVLGTSRKVKTRIIGSDRLNPSMMAAWRPRGENPVLNRFIVSCATSNPTTQVVAMAKITTGQSAVMSKRLRYEPKQASGMTWWLIGGGV
eukprot:584145-Prymnesium_polylepis.1